MAFKGLDVRQTTDRLLFRVYMTSGDGSTVVTTGTTALRLFELQSDGTLKSYDFNDNTFKTTALTTPTGSLTHRTGDNSTYNTGIWTYALTTLTGFTKGNIYFVMTNNTNASPPNQVREIQFGSLEGDVDDGVIGTVTGSPTTTAVAGSSGLSSSDDFYNGSALYFTSGANKDLARKISDYTGSSKTFAFSGSAGTTDAAWPTAPSSGDTFVILGRIG